MNPPPDKTILFLCVSTPTAHLYSHNFKFSVSFLENGVFDKDEIIGSVWAFFSAIKKH